MLVGLPSRFLIFRWAYSIFHLLRDPAGLGDFRKFLDKEFSAENLEFWLACRQLKSLANQQVQEKANQIYE